MIPPCPTPVQTRLVALPARHIVEVDGKRGLFRGLTPRLISSTLSTITRGSVKKAFPLEDMEHVSNKDDVKTSLRKVVKETSHEMMMQCMSRVVSHPLHVISMRCMVQFIGREVKYSGVFGAIGRILKEEGILGFFVGLVPHILGDVIFLWCCSLLAHFINTYAVDDNFSQASVIRSYTKFVIGVACRPPSLCSCIHILDPLLEVSQCSGAAVPWLQPALPQSSHPSRLLPHRLTPGLGEAMNLESSRNPELDLCIVLVFDPNSMVPEQDTSSPVRPAPNWLLDILLQAPAGPKLHPHGCFNQDVQQRAEEC
ncbi:mitochondrial carrier homolog 1 isoform X2 [Strigops habroptila]|uniref:mitochondrial carrier homolog 1 isoform X2 n=1 Tax=Strigops habroptila TaxID=2489341 RepID=UPI0011CF3D40|nr:mitochondrial carrier homolog 1 isoform X2 [Strigops habroptila]